MSNLNSHSFNNEEANKNLTLLAKVIIDALKGIYKNNPSVFLSLSSEPKKIRSLHVLNKIGWWVNNNSPETFNIPKLFQFHSLLFAASLIKCSPEDFAIHFIGSELPVRKVVWYGDQMIFILLFEKLINEIGMAPYPVSGSFYFMLSKHFLNGKDENKIPEEFKSLKASLNKAKANVRVIKIVDDIIHALLS